MFRSEGVRVAVVDEAGRIKLRPVKVGRNYGETVEILDGVGAKERVVLNPSDSLADGDKVEIVVAAATPATGAGKADGAAKDGKEAKANKDAKP
jgi:multidrug efflux pump subunit AcrA (membrane-fusion protein)